MRTNIKATGIELTPALTDYVNEKLGMLDRLLVNCGDVLAEVEIGKETNHHKTGNWFFAETNLNCDGKLLRNVTEKNDLYAAIDVMKDALAEEIRSYEKRKQSLFRRGARNIKRIFFKGGA
ncbi:MAG: ribosome-associated translation inhibitor RaiA [Candidatus Paceibacterota bacterium]|jgi:putative sigma-54 modulation protein